MVGRRVILLLLTIKYRSSIMTLNEIKKRVKYINKIKNDDEAAHSQEDQLYYDFIKYVSTK